MRWGHKHKWHASNKMPTGKASGGSDSAMIRIVARLWRELISSRGDALPVRRRQISEGRQSRPRRRRACPEALCRDRRPPSRIKAQRLLRASLCARQSGPWAPTATPVAGALFASCGTAVTYIVTIQKRVPRSSGLTVRKFARARRRKQKPRGNAELMGGDPYAASISRLSCQFFFDRPPQPQNPGVPER